MRPAVALLSLVTLVMVAGCSTPPAVDGEPGADDGRPLATVPVPDDPILLVSGDAVGNPNSDDGLLLAYDDLAAMPSTELTVRDRFDDEEATFTGVPFADVLAFVGAGTSADVFMHALDDYAVDFTAAELVAADAVLAITDGGQPIALGNGGPVRLVFPRDTEVSDLFDNWIWSLDEVRIG